MKVEFKAQKDIFCGEPGYYVSQYIDGKEVAKQFIHSDHFREFCEAAGINPVIVD